jgi:uncharacterized LabA/DUF88 family protein
MLANLNTPLKRIAIFYDGNFFINTSNYYNYSHSRNKFIDFSGLNEYIRYKVSRFENCSDSLCQIVESHFFRGRFSLNAAKNNGYLETDRLQDQLLMYAGIVPHYYPMNEKKVPPEEKGIDVWLALEAYDLAVHKHFDVIVLFAGDQDYVPLIRKINGLGTRVLIIGVNIEYREQNGKDRYIKTSPSLFHEASYTAMLDRDIDSDEPHLIPVVNNIFSK